MNCKEAELIGMHVGDGTLYLSGKTLVWEMRGDIREKDYYEYVKLLMRDIFDLDLNPKFRGVNSYGIQTTKKEITNFFVDKGFNPGRKVYTVKIPDYIKEADGKIKKSFVRGLFDTDGCVRFDKNRTPYHYYPKIEFSFASPKLSFDLIKLLKELGFRVHSWTSGNCKSLCIAGFENLDKWMKEIKPANNRHIRRVKEGLSNKSKVTLKKRHKP